MQLLWNMDQSANRMDLNSHMNKGLNNAMFPVRNAMEEKLQSMKLASMQRQKQRQELLSTQPHLAQRMADLKQMQSHQEALIMGPLANNLGTKNTLNTQGSPPSASNQVAVPNPFSHTMLGAASAVPTHNNNSSSSSGPMTPHIEPLPQALYQQLHTQQRISPRLVPHQNQQQMQNQREKESQQQRVHAAMDSMSHTPLRLDSLRNLQQSSMNPTELSRRHSTASSSTSSSIGVPNFGSGSGAGLSQVGAIGQHSATQRQNHAVSKPIGSLTDLHSQHAHLLQQQQQQEQRQKQQLLLLQHQQQLLRQRQEQLQREEQHLQQQQQQQQQQAPSKPFDGGFGGLQRNVPMGQQKMIQNSMNSGGVLVRDESLSSRGGDSRISPIGLVMDPAPQPNQPQHFSPSLSPSSTKRKRLEDPDNYSPLPPAQRQRQQSHDDKLSGAVAAAPMTRPTPKVGHRNDFQWMENFEALKKYKQEHGDSLVPRGYDKNPSLASWVAEQRKQYQRIKSDKKSTLTSDRLEALKSIGFEWNAQEAAWSRHIANLRKFKSEFGHVHVALNDKNYPKLGLWVKEQRRHYSLMQQRRPTHMTLTRSQALDDLGFCWDTHEATWRARCLQMKSFIARFGHCNVPEDWSEDDSSNNTLQAWVEQQRRQYPKFLQGKSKYLTVDRVRMLKEIGFVFGNGGDEGKKTESVQG